MRLAEFQRAFFQAVRARGAPPAGLEELFTASATQTAAQRLGVYHEAYWQRQLSVLASTFPRLRSSLGRHFEPLMLRYLERWPSGAPCIEHIGAQLLGFLADQRIGSLERDVACLEWASLLALLAPDCREAELPLQLGPALVDCKLRFAPCLQVECVAQRALTVFRAPPDAAGKLSNEAPAAVALESERVWVALFRRRFAVTHVQIAADEAKALELARRGDAFGSICEAFSGLTLGDAAARATSVLSGWFERGWVTDISIEGSPHVSS